MSNIKCSVTNCKYNDDHNCNASEIKVCCCGCADPCTPSETACSTFDHR